MPATSAHALAFVRFALDTNVLRFGEFKVKSGRISPYFFNAGLFNSGATVARLADFYAQALVDSGIDFDMLFGPAYKGIALSTATSIALTRHPRRAGRDVPFAYNRKEVKDHGEGGRLVGAPLAGQVVIVDDVMTAGTSVRESVDIIRAAGAQPVAVLIAMDRMERAGADGALSSHSAVQEVALRYGIPVVAIATLNDVISLLDSDAAYTAYHAAVLAYRQKYGAAQ